MQSSELGAKYLLGGYNLMTDEDDQECCRVFLLGAGIILL